MTLPEEKQAAALRELVDAMDALRQAEQDVARATVKARSVDVSVNRMAEVSGMSRTKIYAVLKDAEAPSAGEASSGRGQPKRAA